MLSAWLGSDWSVAKQSGPPGVWSGAGLEGACSVFSVCSVSSARVLSAVGGFSHADTAGHRLVFGGHLCESICVGILFPRDVVELQTSEFPF